MDIKQAKEKISSLERFGSKPGLERIKILLEKLDDPQDKLKYVHVAGTNGKGSVSVMTAEILMQAGYKTGLYISPYVTDFRERMQINGEMIPENELSSLVEETFDTVLELINNNVIITEFEYITALAFLWFSRNNCDIVVLETGLGGRFDATNIIEESLVDVITPISLDHTQVLGDTIEKIADEKRQIIKYKSNLVYYRQEKRVNDLIEETAKKQKTRVFHADEAPLLPCKGTINKNGFIFQGKRYLLRLAGKHQIRNAALALCAVNALRKCGFSISNDALTSGFENAFIPARLEYIDGDIPVVIDGAHNPAGMKCLSSAVSQLMSDKDVVCIMGMLKDKDVEASQKQIEGLFSDVIVTSPDSPRAMDAKSLYNIASKYHNNVLIEENCENAFKRALEVGKDKYILICGSLYLASQLRPMVINQTKNIRCALK